MKILHTSDWHLGKRLNGKLRMEEQAAVMAEITKICKENAVDVILIAGDVFDTFVPPAEAEDLFYDTLLELSKTTIPVVIAGNHDDEQRLTAPDGLARASGILLLSDTVGERTFSGNYGGTDTEIELDGKHVTIKRGGEKLNIAYLNYPSGAKLADMAGEADYTDYVRALIGDVTACFTGDAVNIFLSHLFFVESSGGGERELGGSKLLPKEILPKAHYTALGHIHKPLVVSRDPLCRYSGAPMQLAFCDEYEKRVILLSGNADSLTAEDIMLTSYKKLVTVKVGSEAEALEALKSHENDYVRLEYTSGVPLTAKAMSDLRKYECFAEINVVVNLAAGEAENVRRGKTDMELFEMFYAQRTGKQPTAEVKDIFLSAVSGEMGGDAK